VSIFQTTTWKGRANSRQHKCVQFLQEPIVSFFVCVDRIRQPIYQEA
jgi:hypothetical protein